MKEPYRITEYGTFITGKTIDGYITLPSNTFSALENFVLSNRTDDVDALELMSISARKGIGKVITAKNYVGVITMKDGTTIEILPKIFSQETITEGKVINLLVDMLKGISKNSFD